MKLKKTSESISTLKGIIEYIEQICTVADGKLGKHQVPDRGLIPGEVVDTADLLDAFYSDPAKEQEIMDSVFDIWPGDADCSAASFLLLKGRAPVRGEMQEIHRRLVSQGKYFFQYYEPFKMALTETAHD